MGDTTMLTGMAKRLYAAAYRFCSRLFSSANGDWSVLEDPDPWDAAYLLEPPDDDSREQDIRFLRFQLTKLRAEKTELLHQADGLRDKFSALLNMTEGQLQDSACRYDIWEAGREPGWFVATDHCVFCGCGLEIVPFHSKRDALLYAALLQTVGYRPKHNLSCPACYAEYEETREISVE